jgi:predicted phosphodiesterase
MPDGDVDAAEVGGTVDTAALETADVSRRMDVPWLRDPDASDDAPVDAPDDAPSCGGSTECGGSDAGDDTSGPDGAAAFQLVGAPLIFAPTPSGFAINAVLRSGSPSALRARVREESGGDWIALGHPQTPAADIAQWVVAGLAPGRRYDYVIRASDGREGGQEADAGGQAEEILYQGRAVTTRAPGATFTFALLTDSHIQPRDPLPLGTTVGTDFFGFDESTLLAVAGDMAASHPDFMIHLGDMLDYHLFGFNEPPPDASWSRLAYLNYRRLLGDTLGHAAHFAVIGNWDGEDGFFTPEEMERSSSQRLLYVPGPHPDTYPQGGSANQDYYAFTWGDALFVVLNVMTYTPTRHLLGNDPGVADDWTLGADQRAWLERTLAAASSKWRFLFIHHPVGGAAGDSINSAYGRGGGRAARVGEQSLVHDMMLKYGVQILFHGHDHVFTDMTVDGIHYTLPGSAGAPWKFDQSITGYEKFWPDSGHGKVQVGPDRVQVDFIAVGGQVLNSYTVE